MSFSDDLKKWAVGTPISKFFENQYKWRSINYDAVDFSQKKPTIINRGILKFSEFLWYAYGNIENIISEDDYLI